jgi:hypothetical protein
MYIISTHYALTPERASTNNCPRPVTHGKSNVASGRTARYNQIHTHWSPTIFYHARTMKFPVHHFIRHVGLFLAIGLYLALTSSPCNADAPEEYFEKHVRPLLVSHCYDCHGEDLAEANLRLDTKTGWQKGGKSGPAIVPHKPSSSLLIRAITDADNVQLMPPPDAGNPLSDMQIEILTHWVRSGAFDPREGDQIETAIDVAAKTHWSFQPLIPPKLKSNLHPIDELVARQQRLAKTMPVNVANTRELIRRMTYDLHGLPPTVAQLETPATYHSITQFAPLW